MGIGDWANPHNKFIYIKLINKISYFLKTPYFTIFSKNIEKNSTKFI